MTTWPVHRNGDRNARANRRLAGFGWALCTLLAFVPWLARADGDPDARLPGHVLAALSSASKSAPAGASDTDALTLTFVLRRDDEAGFQRYLADVYDPASSEFHRFLSQDQLAQRFGPSQDAYDAVLAFAGAAHFAVSQRSENRLTLSVRASRADVERALALRIDDYTIDGRNFYANDADPLLPADKQLLTSDYTGSGFDRGHMTRSADRTAGNVDNAITFYLTNVVPQMADLNQGVWAQFENALADSARAGRAVYVITGPLYSRSLPLRFVKDEGKIAIPDSTWKVALIGPRNAGHANRRADRRSRTRRLALFAREIHVGDVYFVSDAHTPFPLGRQAPHGMGDLPQRCWRT